MINYFILKRNIFCIFRYRKKSVFHTLFIVVSGVTPTFSHTMISELPNTANTPFISGTKFYSDSFRLAGLAQMDQFFTASRREEVCVNPYHYERVMKIPPTPAISGPKNKSLTVSTINPMFI